MKRGFEWGVDWLDCLGAREVEAQNGDMSRPLWLLGQRGFIIPQKLFLDYAKACFGRYRRGGCRCSCCRLGRIAAEDLSLVYV